MIFLQTTGRKSRPEYLRKAWQLLAGVMSLLLFCVPAFSQGNNGRITGTVMDQSGGSVANAAVTVVDTERGVSRALISDDAGVYNAPNLTPGTYTVRVEAKGFKKLERQNVVVEVGKELRVDLTVQPGEQNQTVTVTESVPLVETTNATMGGTLENADIVDLPLNGRNYQNLLGLRPGVMLQAGGGPWTQSTNGVRPDEAVWMVEGVINMNFFDARPVINMPSPFTDGGTILPVDAIQEFNLMENPKAEYGWKAGAVVNVGIKSGTNTLHGAAYAFGRSDSFDARNYFNPAPTGGSCLLGGGSPLPACDKLPVQLKQFGGVVGGPIVKDKLFFFGGYEGLRSLLGSDFLIPVPATSDMTTAITSLQAHSVPVSGVSLSLLGCQLGPPVTCGLPPTPTTGLYPAQAGNGFLSTFPVTNVTDNGIGKIDYHLNDKNMITGTFFYGKYFAVGEDHGFVNQAFTCTAPLSSLTLVAAWIYTPNSTIVNDFRFGYDRASFNFINVDQNVFANGTATGYPLNTGVTVTGGFPNVNIPGYAGLGTSNNRPQQWSPNPYFDIQDSVSILKGKHSFKFGGEFAHIEADAAIYVYSRGLFNFGGGAAYSGSSGLSDFFAGTPTNGLLLSGNPAVKATWTSTAGYLQDDWRVNQKLIFNLGLRYEYVTPMHEANDNFGSFDPTVGMVQQGHGISNVWKADPLGFEPRVGFAYDLTGQGSTVIRGGGSMIRSSWAIATFMAQFAFQNDGATSIAAVPSGATIQCTTIAGVPGTSSCPSTAGGTDKIAAVSYVPSSICWDPLVPAVGSACGSGQKTAFVPVSQCGNGIGGAASPCDLMGVDPNLKSPYVVNYNLSVTHTFGPDVSLEIGYVGNHGFNLLNFADINQSPVGAGYCANVLTTAQANNACSGGRVANPSPGTYNPIAMQEARPYYAKFPYLGFINYVTNRSHSRYDSLQLNLSKRMSHGLSFSLGYTYAHGFDNGSLNRFGDLPQDSTNLGAENASSDFDIRHRATVTVTYNIPGIKGFAQMLEGWQINSIVNLQSPQAWALWDSGDNISGTGEGADRWNITGSASDFRSGKSSIPYCSGFVGSSAATATCTVVTVDGGGAAPSTVNPSTCTNSPLVNIATLDSFGCYVSANNKSALTPPEIGTFGNMGRNIFRDSGLYNADFSVFKNFKFKERYGAQFRVEVFNIFNRPTVGNPYGASGFVNSNNALTAGGGSLGMSGFTPDWGAGNPLIGSGSQRVMQIGLKISF
jgi:Carboxypeptidase regulatory-like domain/TonB dependent receptor